MSAGFCLPPGARIGLASPALDAHSLGLYAAADLLERSGCRVFIADGVVREALGRPERPESGRAIAAWVRSCGLEALGFSYRLDPRDAARLFMALVETLRSASLLDESGGGIRSLYFAGLPEACGRVEALYPRIAALFRGEESAAETLAAFGVPPSRFPKDVVTTNAYDEARALFGRELVARAEYRGVAPVDRSDAPLFGRRGDTLGARLAHGAARGLPPLMRAHAGPYLPDRREALALFESWTRELARGGLLDVLSIGTSQLTQERFGEKVAGLPDGGGVPIAGPEDYARIWRAARPMLVRTYAGSKRVDLLARIHEESLDIAWHAFSLWWFCETDGRGPNPLRENLREQFRAMRFVASTGKPLEPNVPHHFSFRGADDVSAVAAGYLAAKAARRLGISHLVLQVMLNTPRAIWGTRDLAKARALLAMVRSLEGPDFRLTLQPRAGLDSFSPDPERAKAQLAASAALMDDIEPEDESSPPLVHVVSYSEGFALADPPVIEESIRITRHALEDYRRKRKSGIVPDLRRGASAEALALEVEAGELEAEARTLVAAFETAVPAPYSPEGLYEAFASGFLAAPRLSACREELAAAAGWETRLIGGGMRVVDACGRPVSAAERAAIAAETARTRAAGGGEGDSNV